MVHTVASPPRTKDAPGASKEPGGSIKLCRKDLAVATIAGLVVFSATMVWFVFDHHIPNMDEAGHIINGLKYRDLFSSPRPFRGDWWSSLLTVNQFYPPVFLAYSGFLKALLISSRWIDVLVQCSFTFLLTSSMVLTGRLLGLSLTVSTIAAVLMNLFPEVSAINHQFMMDLPAVAAVSAGILTLCWWRNEPSVKRAFITGIVLGICCLVKQVVAAFLIGTGAYLTISLLFDSKRTNRIKLAAQPAIIVATTMLVGIPWILSNHHVVNDVNGYMSRNFADAGITFSLTGNLLYYAQSFWTSLSPFWCSLFVVSVMAIGWKRFVGLLPVLSMAVCAILMLSAYIYPLERYVVPALIVPAFTIAILLDKMLNSSTAAVRAFGWVAVYVGIIQFVSFNFCPYPLSFSPTLSDVSRFLGVRSNITSSKDPTKDNPVAQVDWGYNWTFDLIESRDGELPVYLNVMVNHPDLNAQSFDLAARERRSPIRPTTSRVWAVVGDKVDFSEETALYYHWYLFKTGSTGFRFKDKESEKNYSRLLEFVTKSEKFKLIGSRKAPDGGTILLYRQSG